MKKFFTHSLLFIGLGSSVLFSGCSSNLAGMARPTIIYELGRNEMEVSEQMTATAEQTKIIGIDFARLFRSSSGNFDANGYAGIMSLPVVGAVINPTKVQNYALYELITKNPTYDFVAYPRFEQSSSGIPFIFTKTKVKVTAKLGKLK